MPRATPLAPLCLVAALVASFAAPVAALAADPVRTTPTTPRTATTPGGKAGPALSAAGRWIVMLRDGAERHGRRDARPGSRGLRRPRLQPRGARLLRQLDAAQFASLREDPDVLALVPDAVITLEAQSTPRGIRRVFGLESPIAKIDGIDQRVDADVAIVDTGIDKEHERPQRRRRRQLLHVQRDAWDDGNGHGTHVAGIVGAEDNGQGVVGVAPGVRLWAVRILNSGGSGLISWYVCGLDWITAQRDPDDPSRPLIEAANMSVAKTGKDDHNCGLTNHDPIHRAICRLVASGVTVVAAAGNNHFNAAKLIPASYNEVITVSALADSDGKPGGLGGQRLLLVGRATTATTRSPTSPTMVVDVDLIAPGKCIWSTLPGGYGYLSGTSMAAPHVTGAVALFKASRPLATPAQVKVALRAAGNHDWKLGTDPDSTHEPCSTCRTSSTSATSRWLRAADRPGPWSGGRDPQNHGRGVRAEDFTGNMICRSSPPPRCRPRSRTRFSPAPTTRPRSLTLPCPPGRRPGPIARP